MMKNRKFNFKFYKTGSFWIAIIVWINVITELFYSHNYSLLTWITFAAAIDFTIDGFYIKRKDFDI